VPEVCGEADEEQHREYGQQNMAHIADAAKSGLDALTEKVTQAQVEQCRRNTQGTRAGKYLILLGVGLGAKPDVLTTFCL
jgi:coproporphyrinogen III oxidase-like Fe-S oxidoreductase